ncbi:hypothetical protein V8G54_023000 [Vigna mungo]|uniref:Uncharacterized protein n=1 Tax=Vigna mungo TaxID=3915 RepID=A0AAQ3RRS4_VIGMU
MTSLAGWCLYNGGLDRDSKGILNRRKRKRLLLVVDSGNGASLAARDNFVLIGRKLVRATLSVKVAVAGEDETTRLHRRRRVAVRRLVLVAEAIGGDKLSDDVAGVTLCRPRMK